MYQLTDLADAMVSCCFSPKGIPYHSNSETQHEQLHLRDRIPNASELGSGYPPPEVLAPVQIQAVPLPIQPPANGLGK